MRQREGIHLLLGLILILFPAPFVSAGEIILRRAVRMPQDRDSLTLGDIATLEGDDARALAETVMWTSDDPARIAKIPLATIRARLDEAGAHRGALHLSGGDVTVRPRPAAGQRPAAMQPASIDEHREVVSVPREHREDTFLAAGLMHEPTVRGAIAQRFIASLRVDPADLRLTFDLNDEDLLAADLNQHRVEIQPTSSLESERATLTVRFWADGLAVRAESVTVRPLLRTAVCRLMRQVGRGEAILESDLSQEAEWISPGAARKYPAADDLVGLLASRGMSEGAALRGQDVRREALIARGERVTVRCISGNVVIALTAEARGDAALGEEVELRKVGERETFLARVTGPGEAVVDLNSD